MTLDGFETYMRDHLRNICVEHLITRSSLRVINKNLSYIFFSVFIVHIGISFDRSDALTALS